MVGQVYCTDGILPGAAAVVVDDVVAAVVAYQDEIVLPSVELPTCMEPRSHLG